MSTRPVPARPTRPVFSSSIVAARLQTLAEPGTIIVAASTRRLLVSIGDLIEDVDASEASEVVDRQLMADQLRNALSDLEPREATIMSLRFGLMDGRPRTLDEIGKHLGLTRERIRQLEKQSLSKLRHPSRAQQLLDFAS